MKVVVFQSKIGEGALTWEYGDAFNESNSKIILNCISSVKDYCYKNGYEYFFNEKDLGWNYEFHSKNDLQLNRLLQNWYHIPKLDYDYILYFDNDVFINDLNVSPPFVDFGMVPRYGDQVLFSKFYYGESSLWFNAGFIMMSRERCKHLSNWILSKIELKKWSQLFKELPREESLIAEYCSQHKPFSLDFKWNTMPPQTPKPLYRHSKYIHLLGPNKLEVLKMCGKSLKDKILCYKSEFNIE